MRHERTERRPPRPPPLRPRPLQVTRDTETVFRDAILAGVLSAEPGDRHYAGRYLYMFHDEDGVAWFKHRNTRAYRTMPAKRHAAGGGP